ncbi:MAG: hypothetical protein ACRESY_05875 [Steroidobacteraceae bacterium]
MFIGHYGPAFGLKGAARPIPLWLLFVGVQWLDVLWALLVLAGVEKLRIIPGFTQGSPLDLYYMPYTHGLPGAIVCSLVFGALVAGWLRVQRLRVFAVACAAAFSHWLLDLVVHVPDLPLYDNHAKVGFGLWRHVRISASVEIVLVLLGAWLYARAVPARRAGADRWLWAFAALLVLLEVYNTLAPPPREAAGMAVTALVAYALLALLAALVDRARGTSR